MYQVSHLWGKTEVRGMSANSVLPPFEILSFECDSEDKVDAILERFECLKEISLERSKNLF